MFELENFSRFSSFFLLILQNNNIQLSCFLCGSSTLLLNTYSNTLVPRNLSFYQVSNLLCPLLACIIICAWPPTTIRLHHRHICAAPSRALQLSSISTRNLPLNTIDLGLRCEQSLATIYIMENWFCESLKRGLLLPNIWLPIMLAKRILVDRFSAMIWQ